VNEKSSVGDLVTQVDREAERAIVEGISAARPEDAIVGEEETDREGSSGVRWIVDPLDGTASYVLGYPGYAVSIGVEVGGRPAVGVVIDAFGRRTEGVVGRGAVRDGVPIRPSERGDLEGAVLATGFAYGAEQRIQQAEALRHVVGRVANIRRSGSAACDLVSVASGEVDAFYELYLAVWDVAAGRAIVEASGGRIHRFEQPDGALLTVAAPPRLFEPLLALLADAGLTTSER
jgi:fructose-1,6-bisphosphatase/inositol monophosphatase family enzyme